MRAKREILCTCNSVFGVREFRIHFYQCKAFMDSMKPESGESQAASIEMQKRCFKRFGAAMVEAMRVRVPGWADMNWAERYEILEAEKQRHYAD